MSRYLLRLDDASEYMDVDQWKRMEDLLDRYLIKPIFGIIPDNQDEVMVGAYSRNQDFWSLAKAWIAKGWEPALHGCEHKYLTKEGGINPVHKRSEFAGLPYVKQAEKIERGWKILLEHGIRPRVFFAPSHTFDACTLEALCKRTEIRIISDTIATDIYKSGDFWFIPQQSGRVREIPFRTVTFCYHPNMMTDGAFVELETFLKKHRERFAALDDLTLGQRTLNAADKLMRAMYFARRR